VLVSSFSPPIDLSPTIAAAMAMLYTTNTNFLYASKENCSDDLKPQQSHALLFLFDLNCPPLLQVFFFISSSHFSLFFFLEIDSEWMRQ
jgi:hypothetical protein